MVQLVELHKVLKVEELHRRKLQRIGGWDASIAKRRSYSCVAWEGKLWIIGGYNARGR